MAYLRELKRQCGTCPNKATVELRTRRNETQGYYCRSCGQRALKTQERIERSNDRAIKENPALKEVLA